MSARVDPVREVPRDDTPPNVSTAAPAGSNSDNLPQASPDISGNALGVRPNRRRRASSASHVSVDFFDPDGVQDLRRTLNRMPTSEVPVTIEEGLSEQPVTVQSPRLSSVGFQDSEASEDTLAAQDASFDFGKTIREVVEKSVFFSSFFSHMM
jgi:hypothetical protein